MSTISIGHLAKSARVSTATLRYYEQLGLIQSRSRADGAVRLFPEETGRKLKAISTLQDLGFTLKEINRILRFDGKPKRGSAQLSQSLGKKLAELDKQQQLQRKLRAKVAKALKDCGNLAQFLGIAS